MRSGTKAQRMAFCGVAAALCVVLMLLGDWIPFLMYISPGLCGVVIMVVCAECGARAAWLAYTAVLLLCAILVADKETALGFAILGCYPLLKPWFDRLPFAPARLAAKLAYLNGTMLAGLALLYWLLFPGGLALAGTEAVVAAVALVIGNYTFWQYDRLLPALLASYQRVWRKRLLIRGGRG